MKIAIVHDWLTNMGGAEKIIQLLHKMYPAAPIYTLLYNGDKMPADFQQMDIKTSFLQKLPLAKTKHQLYLQLMPAAIEQFDLSQYDMVLSSSTACAKGVLTRAGTCHVCYCNTPMRYAWDFYHEYQKNKNWLARAYIAHQLHKIRIWDRVAADRVDYFVANSNNVARRIQKHYRRNAKVIYPPINTEYFIPGTYSGNYFLCAGRLVGYKKVDLAVRTFSRLNLPLRIVGEGPEYKVLKAMAGPTVTFLGRVPDQELLKLYQQCRAFVFPGEEDFGIAPLEAQACGRPVIAYDRGGALETVVNGKTGIFFTQQTEEALIKAVKDFMAVEHQLSIGVIRNHAEKFSEERFKEQLGNYIKEAYQQFNQERRQNDESGLMQQGL
ncbi:glycosyltransferase [Desulfotomaculum sp. 1211_IL3151]|uniref:glycosyltransferase n=1 Tax=Desulfotomaculum sp. 1211_IL3151 TaxID=3084055 RepID=UPI002FD8D6E2